MKGVALVGIVGTLLSMIAFAALYARVITAHRLRLTLGQGVAYLIQWIVAGIMVSLICHPAPR